MREDREPVPTWDGTPDAWQVAGRILSENQTPLGDGVCAGKVDPVIDWKMLEQASPIIPSSIRRITRGFPPLIKTLWGETPSQLGFAPPHSKSVLSSQ